MRGRTRTRLSVFDLRAAQEKRNDDEHRHMLSEEEDYVPQISVINGWEYEEKVPRRRRRRPWITSIAIVLVALIVFVFALMQDLREHARSAEEYSETDKALAIQLHSEDHFYRQPKDLEFNWTVTTGFRSPDGVEKVVYLINGGFPGPTVEARSGDRLIFNVFNDLTDTQGLSIHWHGLKMQDANDMDGALGLTQSAIPRRSSMTYSFVVAENQCGTFWYHADSPLQRSDGLYGGIVIHCPPSDHEKVFGRHDSDQLLMISDWHHIPAGEVLALYNKYQTFGHDPVPISVIVNQAGYFDCAKTTPFLPLVCHQLNAPLLMHLPRGSTRLRIINTGSISGFTIRAINATFSPFALDGDNLVQTSKTTSFGILYPGERVDVLMEPTDGASSAAIQIMTENDNLIPGDTDWIMTSQRFPIAISKPRVEIDVKSHVYRSVVPVLDSFDLQKASSLRRLNYTRSARTMSLYANTIMQPDIGSAPVGTINQTSWIPSADSKQLALVNIAAVQWPTDLHVERMRSGEWVDIVINNMDQGGHTFHLHGHSFYVLYTHSPEVGYGHFNPHDESKHLAPNQPNWNQSPRVKDTVHIPARGHVVIRVKMQKGLWSFGSFVVWHKVNGMSMVFKVD